MKSIPRLPVLCLALGLTLATVTPSCATFPAALGIGEAALTTATAVVDGIDSAVVVYFSLQPNPTKQATIEKAIIAVRAAIVTAAQALQSAQDIDQGQMALAFADLEKTYTDLLALVKDIGVESTATVGARAGVNGVVLVVPTPAQLMPRLK